MTNWLLNPCSRKGSRHFPHWLKCKNPPNTLLNVPKWFLKKVVCWRTFALCGSLKRFYIYKSKEVLVWRWGRTYFHSRMSLIRFFHTFPFSQTEQSQHVATLLLQHKMHLLMEQIWNILWLLLNRFFLGAKWILKWQFISCPFCINQLRSFFLQDPVVAVPPKDAICYNFYLNL